MGTLAREIELAIGELIDSKQTLTPSTIRHLSQQFHQLREYADTDPQGMPPPLPEPALPTASEDSQRLLYIVEDDTALLEQMTGQLQLLGWQVEGFADASSASRALRTKLPSAITIDLSLPEGKLAGIELLQQLSELREKRIPRIVISSAWNWESRLAAVRAGVDVYLMKPLDMTILVEHLDKLTLRNQTEPYRILIVDDDLRLAQHYGQVLDNAGMQARLVTQPELLLKNLTAFQPELILMDLYMPGCSGIEAAQVIRQDRNFLSVPIVFLSTELERHRQLGAMQTGADDFLVKPITDADLVSAVTLRVQRFRNLSTVMHQDSLTGLLNHMSFKLQMETEFARALRNHTSLCFTLIDIDMFKIVNDQYGHPAGDRVLKTLAQLLQIQLRKSDIIGRYGGEEFAVLMPDTGQEQALQVIDDLRKQFLSLHFSEGES